MDLSTFASAQAAQSIRQDMDVGMLTKLKDQQLREGQAAVGLIAASAVARPAEPGKGQNVDVVA